MDRLRLCSSFVLRSDYLVEFHGYVMSQAAIALELRFGKELVARGLMRKSRVFLFVVQHIGRHLISERGLDVEQKTVICCALIHLVVLNLTKRPMGLAF